MSGDPYVCPHGFMSLPICGECPAPTGYIRMFGLDAGVRVTGDAGLDVGRWSRSGWHELTCWRAWAADPDNAGCPCERR